MEYFVCFYTTRPFWTDAKPNIENIKGDQIGFRQTLSERTIEFDNENFYLAFCRDGLIMTQIKHLESKRDEYKNRVNKGESIPSEVQFSAEYLKYLNTLQLILSSSIIKTDNYDYFKNSVIRSGEAFTIFYEDGNFKGSGVPDGITAHYYHGRNLNQYLSDLPISLDQRITVRPEIKLEIFQKCYDDFNQIINNHEAIQILSQLNSAVSEYKNLNFRQALILAWFNIEYFLNKKWIELLESKQFIIDEKRKRINKTRREFLTGQEFSSSIISNLLELNDVINIDLLKKIDNVRKKRNLVVHGHDLKEELIDKIKEKPSKKRVKIIDTNDCWDAFQIIMEFIKNEYNIEIKISEGFQYSSL